ncbi:MAG: Ig-like domain-containing protein [Ferruginibacter sp.]
MQGVCNCTINTVIAVDDYYNTPFNTPVSGNVVLNDSDPEGDLLTVTPQTTTIPGEGTLVLNSDGTFTFTPVPGFYGQTEFIYSVCDDNAVQACTFTTIHILVAPPIQQPNPDFNVTYVNVTVNGDVSTNDHVEPGSTYGSASAVPGNPGPAVPTVNADGTYSFTSAVPGVFVFNVPVCYPGQAAPCTLVLLTITVLDNTVNTNPPVANVDIASTLINTPVTLNTLSNDYAGNPGGSLTPSTVTVTVNPTHGITSVNPSTGEITYTPNSGFIGVDTLTYSVCDNSTPALCATAIQIITVLPNGCANTTVAADDYASTPFNTAVSGNAILNDSDPQGDAQTILAQGTTIQGAGTLILNSDGTWTFTPDAGFSGPVDFPYTVCDNGTPQACANATIHILVGYPVPQLNPDFNVTYVNVPVNGNVSTNDNVPPGSTYGTPSAVPGNPDGSMPTMNADGTYTFVSPVPGVFVFNVPVCVPAQVPPCPTSLLTITVLDNTVASNPPVANVDIASTLINTPVTLNTLANDYAGNPGGSLTPSTVTVTVAPNHGTTSVNPSTGEITYTPANGFTGIDTLTYSVCDNSAPSLCATSIQIITVLPLNNPNTTVAADDYAFTPFNTAVSGNAILNDSDPQGDAQTITAQTTTVPAGTLVLNSDGTWTFTPVAGFSGPVEFPYTVCDNGIPQACANATIHILVGPATQQPNPDFNVTYVNIPVDGNVSTNDHVEAGSTYGPPSAVPGNPDGSMPTMNPDGTYTFVSPVPGVFYFDVPVCAPAQAPPCPTVLLTITVLDNTVNTNPPVANVDIATTLINTPVTLNTLSNDAAGNPGGSLTPSSVTVTVAPNHGTTSVNPSTGEITYTPGPGFTGVDTLSYSVCDNTSPTPLCASSIQIITVIPAIHVNTTAAADDYAFTEYETPVAGNVILNDTDPEGDAQTITPQNTTVPGHGTLVLNSDGTWTFTPDAGFSGSTDFPYTVCDNGTPQACTNATLHIVVSPAGSVPLNLLSFKAVYANGNVKLVWDVTSESNVNKHFVERSTSNGTNYGTIGNVAARNTGVDDRYTFYDNLAGVTSNVLYYRLRSKDINGAEKLSNIAIVRLGNNGHLIVSPNPAKDNIQLSFYSNSRTAGTIQLYNSVGQLVHQQSFTITTAGNQLVPVNNLGRLATGIYSLKVKIGDEELRERIVISH